MDQQREGRAGMRENPGNRIWDARRPHGGARLASHQAFSGSGGDGDVEIRVSVECVGSEQSMWGRGKGNSRRGWTLSRRANVSVEQFKKAK